MQQQTDRFAIDNGLTNANHCFLVQPSGIYVGAGKVHSYVFPEHTSVYSFQSYSGDAIGMAWCPSVEANFGLAMAFAASVRWDDMQDAE